MFDRGNTFALRDIVTVKGVSRVMTFHGPARLDGLVSREELVGRKLVERFEGRDDRLYYKCVAGGAGAKGTSPPACWQWFLPAGGRRPAKAAWSGG